MKRRRSPPRPRLGGRKGARLETGPTESKHLVRKTSKLNPERCFLMTFTVSEKRVLPGVVLLVGLIYAFIAVAFYFD